MLLSIITVAFRNLEGIVKTHASLAHLAQVEDISFEWIVVDGGSNDGTREYLENLNGIFNLRQMRQRGMCFDYPFEVT
ncbi:glycosyltransferase, partial [Escherichia sp. HC-TM1]